MVKTAETYHVPVLLKPSVDGLNIQSGGIYVDVTFGGGGHSREILSRLDNQAHLYSFDQDADAEQNVMHREGSAEKRFVDDARFTFVRSNFRYLKNWMRYYGVEKIDGLLADLGVSSHHFDDESRGFSFRFDAPLDMRMNKREREKKDMAKLFQALRIEVNHEMDALKEMLQSATELLRSGGRLSVITYHSLEDRIVKNMMKAGNAEGKKVQDFYGRIETPFNLLNNKVIVPSADEQQENPRSRSAKLRIAEKK